MILNDTEQRVLNALIESSEGNGHDFGCLEDLTGPWGTVEGLTQQQIGGYITSLQAKGLIEVDEPRFMEDHGHNVTQFELTDLGFKVAGIEDENPRR